MPYIEGDLISGKFDSSEKIFSLQKVKNFSIQTNLNEKLTNHLYSYLKVHEQDEDGIILTLYDQIPIMITRNEVKKLLKDLERVKLLFH
ncbi:hypothetical protein ACF5W4_09490 [Bacillota bacterium Lsc_1132]